MNQISMKPEEYVLAGGAIETSRPPTFSSLLSRASLLGDRPGSVLTEGCGVFALEYDDACFRRPNPDERRPDLLLVVRAPEDMDGLSDDGVLHVSRDIRQGASSRETFIVRIAAAKLAVEEVRTPSTRARDEEEEPEAVIEQVRRSVSRPARVEQEVQKIAAEQVAATRARLVDVERQVETRLLERLTGVPDRLAERLNYVRPGADVDAAMFAAVRKSFEGTVNRAAPASGYLVGGAKARQRLTFMVRENPVELLGQAQPKLALDGGGVGANGARGDRAREDDGAGGNAAALASLTTLTPDHIPGLLERLMGTITSPEEAIAFGLEPRATPAGVDDAIGAFQLRAGPADVPALGTLRDPEFDPPGNRRSTVKAAGGNPCHSNFPTLSCPSALRRHARRRVREQPSRSMSGANSRCSSQDG